MIRAENRWHGAWAAKRWRSSSPGFTLIEVLVVLAILVILFGLLFAPMIASLDMVTLAQSRVRMQDAVRTAMEQMRREIGNAMYIYPTPTTTLPGADALLGTADDTRIPNYSEIVFVAPARDSSGHVIDPPAPRTDSSGNIISTRFRAALVDETATYNEDNSYILVREEGYYTYDDATYTWTFTNVGGATPVRNALTPRRGYDLPITTSICMACGAQVGGYITQCLDASCASSAIVHVHGHLQFKPERIIGEVLKASNNYTLYRSRHAGWAGFDNPGDTQLNDLRGDGTGILMALGASELDPRILIYHSTDMSAPPTRDSYAPVDWSNVLLTWNSEAGAIQVGATTKRPVTVSTPMAAVPMGSFYALDAAGDAWNSSGDHPSPITSDIIPVPDKAEAAATGVAMPSAYTIDPRMGNTEPPAKVVPGSVKVRVVATTATNTYQRTYTETTTLNPTEIGVGQFAVRLDDYDRRAQVLFNKYHPPSPRLFDGNDPDREPDVVLTDFKIYIEYYFRRNFDPSSPANDDIIKADYSTREIININLALQRYIELEPDPGNPAALVVPADAMRDRVAMKDQVRVRNLGR